MKDAADLPRVSIGLGPGLRACSGFRPGAANSSARRAKTVDFGTMLCPQRDKEPGLVITAVQTL